MCGLCRRSLLLPFEYIFRGIISMDSAYAEGNTNVLRCAHFSLHGSYCKGWRVIRIYFDTAGRGRGDLCFFYLFSDRHRALVDE